MIKRILFFTISLFSVSLFSQEDISDVTIDDSKFSVSASIGPSYKIGKRASYPEIGNYIEDDRFGYTYEVDIMYDINDRSSYGIKINNFESGDSSNNQNILFIGASYTSYSRTLNPLNSSCLNFSFGYISFTNHIDDDIKLTLKGGTLGMNVSYAYYYGLGPKFQLGPKMSLIGGALTKINVESETEQVKCNGENTGEIRFAVVAGTAPFTYRGLKVENAVAILEHHPQHSAIPLRKLVMSAVSNWKQKNDAGNVEALMVKTIFVDGARSIKRMLPAPQGRAYRMRKRSNHVTVIVDTNN